MSRRFSLLAVALTVAVPALLYLPTLKFGFLFDDRPLLVENPVVTSPHGVAELFTSDLDPRSRQSETPTTNYLRPLFLALAAGLSNLFGDRPLGWHATAVLLHALLGAMAWRVLVREQIGPLSALGGALLFALHPAHAQSAAWVSGLQDLVFGAAALAAFLVYRRVRRSDRPSAAGLTLLGLSFALALLAKEPAIGLLLFVAGEAFGWIPAAPTEREGRRPWAELAVLAAVQAAYFAYRWSVLGTLAHRFPTAPATPEALASIPVALLAYLRDLCWPVELFLLHPARPVSAWLSAESLSAAAVLLLLVVGVAFALHRRRERVRPVAWFVAWIAPVLALWAVNPEWMVMDRYLLLPSLALGWILALELPLEEGRRTLRATLWLLLLGLLCIASLWATRPFASETAFWNRAIVADPGSSTAWAEKGRLLADAGDLEGAAAAFDRAVALDPRAQLPRLRQALLALRRGESASAIQSLQELVERNPGYLPAWRNLVVAQGRAGDLAGAGATLERALERFPQDALLWTQRAIVLRQANRPDAALEAIRRAATLAPGDAALALREATLLAELGRREEARRAAARGLTLAAPPEIRAELESLAR